MSRIIGSPLRYIQGPNEIENIFNDIADWGKNFLFILDKPVAQKVQPKIITAFEKGNAKIKDKKDQHEIKFENFNGESSMVEIDRLAKIAAASKCDVIIAVGGGKCADAVKAAAYKAKAVCIIFSTAASCDAPCSHSAIIYKENHEFDQYYYPVKSPEMVIVDSKIIAEAPVRLLKAGLGDALSTYFEARSAYATNREVTEWKGHPSITGLALAELCYKTILKDGFKACVACENKVVTEALENVIEANTYLSTIGFESGGLGAAHSIQDALSLIPEIHACYHGEKVAFGTICHLVLENASAAELNKVLAFCVSVDLPVCLKDLHVEKLDKELLNKVAEKATGPGVPMGNMPFKVTPDKVSAAIIVADKLGTYFKEHGCIPGDDDSCCCDCGCDCCEC